MGFHICGYCNREPCKCRQIVDSEYEMRKIRERQMKSNMYYVLSVSDDGDKYLDSYTEKQLNKILTKRMRDEEGFSVDDYLSEIPSEGLDYVCGKAIIFKGEIVVPKIKKEVTKVEI